MGRVGQGPGDHPGQLGDEPTVRAEVDEGYRGVANEFPDQVSAPPKTPMALDDGPLTERHAWREMRRRQSSRTELALFCTMAC